MRPSLLLVLALTGLAHAAPAPSRPSRGPEQAPVLLTGRLRGERPVGSPSVIACQTDWEAFAKVLGIQGPPRVNFQTHFLFVLLQDRHGELRCEVDGSGDLRASSNLSPEAIDLGFLGIEEEHLGEKTVLFPRYLVKSFPRSAVKTVNGLTLPK